MAQEQFQNNLPSTLAAACLVSDTQITVTNSAAFLTTGNYRLVIDNEIMLATSISGNIVQVNRAQEGTAQVPHAFGADVLPEITAGALTQLKADIEGAVSGTGFLHVTGGVWDSAAANVNLASEVTGVLPTANGGTGLSAIGANHSVLTSTGTALAFVATLAASVLPAISITGDVFGSGAGGSIATTVEALQGYAVATTAPTMNYVLTWNGSAWAPAASGGGGGITALTQDAVASGSGSVAVTVVQMQDGAMVCNVPSGGTAGGTLSGYLSSTNHTGYALGQGASGSAVTALTFGYANISGGLGVYNAFAIAGDGTNTYVGNSSPGGSIFFTQDQSTVFGSWLQTSGVGNLQIGSYQDFAGGAGVIGLRAATTAASGGTAISGSVVIWAKHSTPLGASSLFFMNDAGTVFDLSQSGGGGITALTGQVTASGSGSVVATITNGTADQLFDTNHAGTASEWFTVGGDLAYASHSFEVTGLLTHALPSLTAGYLNWTGSAWALSAVSSVTWADDLSGSSSTNQWVASITGSAGGGGAVPLTNGAAITSASGSHSYIDLTAANAVYGYVSALSLLSTVVDAATGATMNVGGNTQTALNIGRNTIQNTVKGPLTVSVLTVGVVHSTSAGVLSSSIGSGNQILVTNSGATDTAWSSTIIAAAVAPGTSAQVFLSNATPTATWTTISGDSAISATGVMTNTQAQGGEYVFGAGGTMTWAMGATPLITQASTSSATPATMTITPQASTAGATANGSILNVDLTSPGGSGSYGYFSITQGSNVVAYITSFPLNTSYGAVYLTGSPPDAQPSNAVILGDTSYAYFNGPVSGQGIMSAGLGIVSTWNLNSIQFFNSVTLALGGGAGVMGISNATTNPSSTPVGGGVLYSNGGALTWLGSSGTTTVLGPADLFEDTDDKHCPKCHGDFGHSWKNPTTRRKLTVCMWCLTEELGERDYIVREAA
jgi:hypothetical protein